MPPGYPEGVHQALIKYTAMRLAIFVAVLIGLGLIMGRSLLLIVFAWVISVALSYLFLRKPREEVSLALAERTRRRLDEKSAAREAGLDRSDDEVEDALAAEAVRAEPDQQPK